MVPRCSTANNFMKTGAGGGTRTPTGLAAQRIFMPSAAFAAPPCGRVCGLDYPFTLSHGVFKDLGAACSSLHLPERGFPSGLSSGLPC